MFPMIISQHLSFEEEGDVGSIVCSGNYDRLVPQIHDLADNYLQRLCRCHGNTACHSATQ